MSKKKKTSKEKKPTKLPIVFIALVTVGENKFSGYYPEFGQSVVLSYRRWASSMLTLLRVGDISLEALMEMPHWHTVMCLKCTEKYSEIESKKHLCVAYLVCL